MKEIRLSKGKVALVDDEDFDWLSQWRWYAQECKPGMFYAARRVGAGLGYMHRIILEASPGRIVDHADGNTLNNTKSNIRLATRSQNSHNAPSQFRRSRTSHYRGVCWNKDRQKWQARLYVDRQPYHLGYFDDEREAALAYDRAAAEHLGEYARPNLAEFHRAGGRARAANGRDRRGRFVASGAGRHDDDHLLEAF